MGTLGSKPIITALTGAEYIPVVDPVGVTGGNKRISTSDLATYIETGSSILAPNAQTGNYTLVLTDLNKVVEVTSATAKTVTVPANASVAFAVGNVVGVYQGGAGQVSIAAAGGVTIESRGSLLNVAGQYGEVSLRKRATNTWVLAGDLA